jgi:hypothetical protein
MPSMEKEMNNENQAENMAVESIGIDEEETRTGRLGDEDRDDQKAVRGDEKEEKKRRKRGKKNSV